MASTTRTTSPDTDIHRIRSLDNARGTDRMSGKGMVVIKANGDPLGIDRVERVTCPQGRTKLNTGVAPLGLWKPLMTFPQGVALG